MLKSTKIFLGISLLLSEVVIPKVVHSQSPPSSTVDNPVCHIQTTDGRTINLSQICGQTPSTSNTESSSNVPFLVQSKKLERMLSQPNLFQGGNGIPVTFDSQLASQQGFSPDDIELAEQLVALTNDLMTTSKKAGHGDVTQVDIDISKYDRVERYFQQANTFTNNFKDKAKDYLKAEKLQTESNVKQIPLAEIWKANICGVWWNPRPSRGAPWINHSSSNPANKLRSWGYHETPSFAGAGWTRPQTYNRWVCGWNTYRDHAYILNRTIREQKYTGWKPNGEPNPEVWASGPWPYAIWPAYVRWWHSRY